MQWICAAQLQRQSNFDIRSPMARRFRDPFRAAMGSIRMGGLIGLLGARAAMIGGQMADDGEEAFEKKFGSRYFRVPASEHIRSKYRK